MNRKKQQIWSMPIISNVTGLNTAIKDTDCQSELKKTNVCCL